MKKQSRPTRPTRGSPRASPRAGSSSRQSSPLRGVSPVRAPSPKSIAQAKSTGKESFAETNGVPDIVAEPPLPAPPFGAVTRDSSDGRPTIEPVDDIDAELEQRIVVFCGFEQQLESYYWRCGELRKYLCRLVQSMSLLAEKARSFAKNTDNGLNRLDAYIGKTQEALSILNSGFNKAYEKQLLAPIGQAKLSFPEIRQMIMERDQFRVEVRHYQVKIAAFTKDKSKRTMRNYEKLRGAFAQLEVISSKVSAGLEFAETLRKSIVSVKVNDLFKLINDVLVECATDIQTITRMEQSVGKYGQDGDSDTERRSFQMLFSRMDAQDGNPVELQSAKRHAKIGGFLVRHMMKQKSPLDLQQMMQSDKEFVSAIHVFREVETSFPEYRDHIVQVRDCTRDFLKACLGIVEDVVTMGDGEGDTTHVQNYRQLFLASLSKVNREITQMYEQQFIMPVENEIEAFGGIHDNVTHRMKSLLDYYHCKAKVEQLEKRVHDDHRTLRNKNKFTQLQEDLRHESSELIRKFEEIDAVRNAIVMFHVPEMMEMQANLMQEVCTNLKGIRHEWRRRRQHAKSDHSSQISRMPSWKAPPRSSPRSKEASTRRLASTSERETTRHSLDDISENTRLDTSTKESAVPNRHSESSATQSPSQTLKSSSAFTASERVQDTAGLQFSLPPAQLRVSSPITQPKTASSPMSSLQVGEHLTRALVECFEEYDVEIAEEGPMGMRMTRELETSSVTGTIIEWSVIKLVVQGSLADRAGVLVGSLLVEVDGSSVVGVPQEQLTEIIKYRPRPLLLKFVRKRNTNFEKVSSTTSTPTAAAAAASLPLDSITPQQQLHLLALPPPKEPPPPSPGPPPLPAPMPISQESARPHRTHRTARAAMGNSDAFKRSLRKAKSTSSEDDDSSDDMQRSRNVRK